MLQTQLEIARELLELNMVKPVDASIQEHYFYMIETVIPTALEYIKEYQHFSMDVVSNCCGGAVLGADGNNHGMCSLCKENCVGEYESN